MCHPFETTGGCCSEKLPNKKSHQKLFRFPNPVWSGLFLWPVLVRFDQATTTPDPFELPQPDVPQFQAWKNKSVGGKIRRSTGSNFPLKMGARRRVGFLDVGYRYIEKPVFLLISILFCKVNESRSSFLKINALEKVFPAFRITHMSIFGIPFVKFQVCMCNSSNLAGRFCSHNFHTG